MVKRSEVDVFKGGTPQNKYAYQNTRFWSKFAQPQKTKIFYGGAGSGKSLSIAQYFLSLLCNNDGKRRAVLRKTFPSMATTTYLVLKDVLSDWGVPYKENKTKHYFEVGRNKLYYLSLDNPEKIKGGEFSDIWLEESTEFTKDDYLQLEIRLSRDRESENPHMFMSFNPIDANHWCVKLAEEALEDRKNFLVMHSTYHDNIRFLSRSFVRSLEKLIESDENYYRVYCLGEPGILKNIIYRNYVIENPLDWPSYIFKAPTAYGLDFGFNNHMVLIQIYMFEGIPYIVERYAKDKKTTEDLYIWMNENNISSTAEIWADSARPDQIQSLCESKEINGVQYHGFNVLPAKKDVIAGIDAVKSRRLHISSDSPRIITEIKGYKYKENKDGVVLEEPVKFRDDAMDSIRYCIFSGDWIEGDIITENRPHMKNAPVEVYQINTNAPSKVYQL